MNTQAHILITTLQRGGAYGYWWTAEGRQSFWWDSEHPTALPGGRRNTYFGVHPVERIPETNRNGEHTESRALRSQIGVIAALNCLFAEYDAKDYNNDKAETFAAVEALEPPPSAIVDSGGGYHCYWLFNEPYPLTTDEARKEASKIQGAWVKLMGGDTAAKDLARVLRVPGTKNYKYDPPRDVKVIDITPRRYTYAELAALAAPFVESDKPATVQAKNSTPTERYAAAAMAGELARVFAAPEGQKHHQIYKSAAALGELVGAGALDEATVKDLLYNAIAPRAADAKNAAVTIADGVTKGKTNPRKVPAPRTYTTASGITVEQNAAPIAKEAEHTEAVDWRSFGITAADLYHKHFDPLIWTVENIIPESTCLLAGKPKSKKSWFALGIACACAFGGKALGRLNVRAGRVLYLDLESNQRRAKSRLFSIVGSAMERLTNLHIFTKWERGDAAMDQLEAWMQAYPDTTLIVIDVLADFRRPIEKHEQPYAYDRDTLAPITEFADRHRITVLLIHHTRKAKADDVFDEISGSTGLISAVGTALILGRSPNGANEMILDLRGRDLVNDDPLALEWDDYTCQHIITGGAVDAKMGAERRQVLAVFADDKDWTPKDVAAELQKPVNNVQQMIKLLLSEGMLERTGRGKYVRVLGRDQNDQNDQNHKNVQDDQRWRVPEGFDSDHSDLPLEGDQNQDQNHFPHSNSLNGAKKVDSDHSDLLYRDTARTLAAHLKNRDQSTSSVDAFLSETNTDTEFSQFTGVPLEEDSNVEEL